MRSKIHSKDLSPESAREFWHLTKDPPLSRANKSGNPGKADSFAYRLTVTTPEESRDYAFTESEVGAELRPLIQRLERELTI